jgi:hypothetical protein
LTLAVVKITHGPELDHLEGFSGKAGTDLPEQNRCTNGFPKFPGNTEHYRGKQHQAKTGKHYVQQALNHEFP